MTPRTPRTIVAVVSLLLALGLFAPGAAAASTTPAPRRAAATSAASATPAASETPAAGETGTYIVRFRPGVDPAAMARTRTARVGRVGRVLTKVFPGVITTLSGAQAAALADDPAVEAVEPDGPVRTADLQRDSTWGLDRIDQRQQPLDDGYLYPAAAGSGVNAYVVDTGVRADHQDFTGRVRTGHTVIADGWGTGDCHGHGTHVAGTVAGTQWGVAKKASIIPVRVLDCLGDGLNSGVVSALEWIVGHHQAGQRAVVNLSIVGDPSSAVDAAVARVVDDGVVAVVAAGNDGGEACAASPARAASALTVGATDVDDWRAGFSNFGRCLDLFAPGVDIRSASRASSTASTTMSGTSMASPHVAGAAAVLWSQDGTLTSSAVASRVVSTTTKDIVLDAGSGSFNRMLHSPPPRPANDDLARATLLDVTRAGSSAGSTIGASAQTGEPAHSGQPAVRTLWWAFTAPATGELALSVTTTGVRAVVAVYSGTTFATMTRRAASDPASTTGGGVRVPVVGGQTYRVAVDGWTGDQGSVTLQHGGLGTSPDAPWYPFASAGAMVDQHFADVVGRAPTATERSRWTTALMDGSATGATMVVSLRGSDDGRLVVDPTVRLYRAVLRRTPEQDGLLYWLDQRRNKGWTLTRTAEAFVRSEEFVRRYGTLSNRDFVTLIYTDVLDRPGDTEGIDFWTAQLDSGRRTRGAVMIQFSESKEYRDAFVHHVDAIVAHSALLGRPPTDDEVEAWVTRRRAGGTHQARIRELLVGAEYGTRVGSPG